MGKFYKQFDNYIDGIRKVQDLVVGDLFWPRMHSHKIMQVDRVEFENGRYNVIGYCINEFTNEYEKLPSTGNKFLTVASYRESELVTLAQKVGSV